MFGVTLRCLLPSNYNTTRQTNIHNARNAKEKLARQQRHHCQEEGKDEDGAERSCCRSQEEGQDGDGVVSEVKKEEKERMRLEGG